jgi:phosphoglycolate phosphatase
MSQAMILFDLDGTLADTNRDLHATMNYILNQYGCDRVETDQVRHMIGGGARMILKRGFDENKFEISDSELDIATERFVDYYDKHIDDETVLFNNVENILKAAKRDAIKMAVVTNKREGLAAKLLFRLNIHHYFDVLIGGDTLPERKPNPLPILEAIKRLGGTAKNAIMIGDSEADTASAMKANVSCICVSFGYRRVTLEELNADSIIDDFAQLPQAMATLKPDLFSDFRV